MPTPTFPPVPYVSLGSGEEGKHFFQTFGQTGEPLMSLKVLRDSFPYFREVPSEVTLTHPGDTAVRFGIQS